MPRRWSLWKDVLYPGRVVVPGPDGTPISYTFTPADVRATAAAGNAKLAAGWAVPGCWEHQDVGPSRRSVRLSQGERDRDFARGVFCHADAFRVVGGHTQVRLAGDDPADLRQFRKVRFVSPEVQWDWMDSDGRVWAGPTITHVAATPRPVQRHQLPAGAIRMSQGGTGKTRLLTYADGAVVGAENPPRVGPTISPVTRPRLIRLGLSDYAGGNPMADETETTTGGGAEKASPWQRIADALAEHCGLMLGDVSKIADPEIFATIVEVAAANYKAGQGPDDLEDEDDLDDEDAPPPGGDLEAPPPGAAEPPPPIQMSLKAQEHKAQSLARKNLADRITALGSDRRAGPAVVEDLHKRLKTLRLSFSAAGEVEPNDVTVRLDALEQNPRGAAWNPTAPGKRGKKGGKARLSHRAERPESPYREQSPADDDAIVAAFEKHAGRGE